MKIYDSHTKNFNNNGYGILRDAISCKCINYLNDTYRVEFEYPINGYLSEYLIFGNLIKINVGEEEEQIFRIKLAPRTLKTINVVAEHVFFDLNDNFLVDVRPIKKNGTNALNHILRNTQYENNFVALGDISKENSAEYVRQNVVDALLYTDNCFAKRWGAELERNNFTINAKENLGVDRGVKVQYGRNVQGIKWDFDVSELATRIMPVGTNGLLLPEKFIDSPNINDYPTPIIKKLTCNTIGILDGEISEEQAYDLMRQYVQEKYDSGIDQIVINLDIDMVDLSKTTAYKQYVAFEQIKLGDIVTADIPILNINQKLKVIGIEYDCLAHKNVKIYLSNGTKKITNYLTSISNNINDLSNKIDDSNNNLGQNLLQQAKKNATDLLNNAMGGFVYKTNDELFIMDTDNISTATKIWRWNINGLGYSDNGIKGPYKTAITMDGKIVADMITAGTMQMDRIEGLSNAIEGINNSIEFNQENIILISQKNDKNTERIAQIEYNNNEINTVITKKTTEINDNIISLKEEQNQILQNLNGTVQTISSTGGNNLFKNAIGYFGSTSWQGTICPFTNSEIQINSGEKSCWLLKNGTANQTMQVKNGNYTISFLYKKIKTLANCKVKINDVEFILNSENFTEFEYSFEVTNNTINFEMTSDSDDSCYVCILMCNFGTVKQPYSNNANETVTDTVKIGEGIEIISSKMNTKQKQDADGNRIINVNTNEVVTEYTDKGIKTIDFESSGTSKVSGILFTDLKNGHHWITGL